MTLELRSLVLVTSVPSVLCSPEHRTLVLENTEYD